MVFKFQGKIFGQNFPIIFMKAAAGVNYVSEMSGKAQNSSAPVAPASLDVCF